MTTQSKCAICDEPLAAQAIDGLCLRCLARLGFAAEAGTQVLSTLGDYELISEISRGGMGVIYRARQRRLNRLVALKVVLHGPFSSPEFVRRFQTEAEAAASLKHPHIVPVYEVGESGGHHYLSMEFIEGVNFAELVRDQPLPPERAAGYLEKIARAVQYAHERGVLHRDLKPSNILLDPFDQPRVTDFGLAKLAHRDTEITAAGQVFGSPSHMPPEQAAGRFSESTPASDVYSLGSILYQLLTGRPPFQGETLQDILLQVQTVEPIAPRRLRPSIPASLETICLKCLHKDPARRYHSAAALADDLNAFLDGRPIQARPSGAGERLWLWSRRRPVLAALSAALILVTLLGVAGISWQWRRAEATAREESILRQAAQDQAEQTRLNLYAADINLAAQAIQADNYGLARRLLGNLAPAPGQSDPRGFEWRYLWNRSAGQELATLAGHDWIVADVDFSPDGKTVASASVDGSARLWDWAGRRCLDTFRSTTGAVMSVRFTPDSRHVILAGVSGAEMRDVKTGKLENHFPTRLVSLPREGELMATSDSSPFYYEQAGEVALWNWHTGAKLRTFPKTGHALALSPDGHRLAVAETTPKIDLYNADTAELLRVLPTTVPVWHLSFSPDNSQLLAAGWTSNVLLWNVNDAAPPRVLTGHRAMVWSAVFSPDGKTIATASSDQTVRLWDAATLQQKQEWRGHASEVWCVAFSPDGALLVSGGKDSQVLLWNATPAPARPAISHQRYARPFFSPDGKYLVTAAAGREASQLWDAQECRLLVRSFGYGQEAGFDDQGRVVSFDADGMALQFWDPSRRAERGSLPLQKPSKAGVDFSEKGLSPDGQYFFAADGAGFIEVWSIKSGGLIGSLQGPSPPLRNIVLGPGGRQLLVCVERENFARLYDCRTGKEFNLGGHKDFVGGMAFSPDGTLAATGSMDGTIRLWQTADGSFRAALPGHVGETTDLAFSPDGRTLASLCRKDSLKLWHLPTLREVYSQPVPNAGGFLQFSPDGRRLAVNTDDDQLLLLDAP